MSVELGPCSTIVRREALRRAGIEDEVLAWAVGSQVHTYDADLIAFNSMGNDDYLEKLTAQGLVVGDDIAGARCSWLERENLGTGAGVYPIFQCRSARLKGTSLLPVCEQGMSVARRDKCGQPRPWLDQQNSAVTDQCESTVTDCQVGAGGHDAPASRSAHHTNRNQGREKSTIKLLWREFLDPGKTGQEVRSTLTSLFFCALLPLFLFSIGYNWLGLTVMGFSSLWLLHKMVTPRKPPGD